MTDAKRVSRPWQDPRGKYNRSGKLQWTVTVKEGAFIQMHRFETKKEAQAFATKTRREFQEA